MHFSKSYLRGLWAVIKNTFSGFLEHKSLKMSASLAYITVFSIGPFLLVILYLSDLFWGREAIEGTIYNQIKNFLGEAGAEQVQLIIKNLSVSDAGSIAGIVGVITLIFGATSVFAEIQDSINTIWGIKPKKKSGFWLYVKSRLLSFGVIGSFGFILLVSLGVSAIMDALGDRLLRVFPDITVYIAYALNLVLTFLITTLLFGAIFTILPDAKIKWKQVKTASFTTALLFMLGKFIISFYISSSNINSVYGTAGALVVLMIWVYYSSALLYLGAEFAKCYAIQFNYPIKPSAFAEFVHQVEIQSNVETMQKAKIESEEIKKTSN